ncbi:MBL fold metallo-hydrolase [Sphingomonas crocodyli]|nr:MBL fold metallo-hydrolase [Sphingomonas crocodyli]
MMFGAPVAPVKAAQPAYLTSVLKVRQLHPNMYVIEGPANGEGPNPNMIIYATGHGVVVVDPWFAIDYLHVLAAIRSVTSEPVRYVVNTHFHEDHSGANAEWPADVMIIAQDNSRKHMLEQAMPGPPNITFSDELTLHLGEKTVRLRYLGPGHTDGDIAVYFPEWKTVCLGDMMAGTKGVTNPVVGYASGGTLAGWPRALDKALAFDVAEVVPGHGAITGRDGLVAHRDKVAAIGDSLRAWDRAKKSAAEIHDLLISTYGFKPINLASLDGLVTEFR